MAALAIGSVVLVPFPFSDLSRSKLRPVILLAKVEYGDVILCQITSNPYSDPLAVKLTQECFESGSLHKVSYARPGKLFTGNGQIIVREIGRLNNNTMDRIINKVRGLFKTRSN